MTNVCCFCVGIGIRIFSPALDWEKEILLNLRSGIVHAIMHLHHCILRI